MQNSAAVKKENKSHMDVKKLTVMAVMTAMAYIAMVLFKIPVVSFLKYEPKDVIITIGGFLFGPLASVLMSAVVSLVEMVTVSDTGPIGALMNFISTCSFACMASLIYKKWHSIKGAVAGLAVGAVSMVIIMLAWNYLVTPIYMGVDRNVVAAMLPTVFLPFNLLKGVLNSAITMLIYKPLSNIMRKAHVLPESDSHKGGEASGAKRFIFVYIIAAFVIATCVAVIVIWKTQQ